MLGTDAPPEPDPAEVRRRLGPDERRAQLVATGLAIARSQPLDLLTAHHVAELAGVSKALVYHYFPTHRDLQAAIAKAAADELLGLFSAIDGSQPLEAQLEQGLAGFISYVEQQPHSYAAIARAAASDAALQQVFEDTRRGIADIIIGVLSMDQASNRLRLVVRGWIALTEEMTVEWVQDRSMDRDELVAFLRDTAFQMISAALG